MDNKRFTIPRRSPPPSSSSASSLGASSSSQTPRPDQTTSASLPAPQPLRSNRKLLPTRATRTSDANTRKAPEWEGMAKLLSQFHNRADAGEREYCLTSGQNAVLVCIINNFLLILFYHYFIMSHCTQHYYLQCHSEIPSIGKLSVSSTIPESLPSPWTLV